MNRKEWILLMDKIYNPVFKNFSQDNFKMFFITDKSTTKDRVEAQYLEAFARSFLSISRWINIQQCNEDEEKLRVQYLKWILKSLDNIVDDSKKDKLDFCGTPQALVDTAFLAQALFRSYDSVFINLSNKTKAKILMALKSSRIIKPCFSNWLLFSAMIEAFLYKVEGKCDLMRIDFALKQFDQWYKGDGIYGDGPDLKFDYYNSFVIYPMMLEILDIVENIDKEWKDLKSIVLKRAQRYATIQERMISPEGTFPVVGRSLAYRMAVFHHLSHMAYREKLEQGITLAQVRDALWVVTNRMMSNKNNFDEKGWLNIGFTSNQPLIGENYINKGSVYLCGVIFEILGKDENHLIWTSPHSSWTSKKLWCEFNDISKDISL